MNIGVYCTVGDTAKAPLCKGGWQKSAIFDWGIVIFCNPSEQNQRFCPPPLAQGRLALRAPNSPINENFMHISYNQYIIQKNP